MYKDQNLIRVLAACETMGNATNICSDKVNQSTMLVFSSVIEEGVHSLAFIFLNGLGHGDLPLSPPPRSGCINPVSNAITHILIINVFFLKYFFLSLCIFSSGNKNRQERWRRIRWQQLKDGFRIRCWASLISRALILCRNSPWRWSRRTLLLTDLATSTSRTTR